jgi:hypothetical protein
MIKDYDKILNNLFSYVGVEPKLRPWIKKLFIPSVEFVSNYSNQAGNCGLYTRFGGLPLVASDFDFDWPKMDCQRVLNEYAKNNPNLSLIDSYRAVIKDQKTAPLEFVGSIDLNQTNCLESLLPFLPINGGILYFFASLSLFPFD